MLGRRCRFLLASLVLPLLPVLGGAAGERRTVSLGLSPARQVAGADTVAEFNFTLPEGHYVWHDSIEVKIGDSGPPGDALGAGKLLLPEPKTKYDEYAGREVDYLDGRFGVRQVLRIEEGAEPGEYPLELSVDYIECSPTFCRLGSDTLTAELTVLPAGGKTPVPAVGADRERPAEPSEAAPSTPAEEGWFGGQTPVMAILLAFVAGLGLAFTPCVYPLIPITVGLVGATSGRGKLSGLGRSLIYVLGISMTYAAAGTLAALTGGLFGEALQHPAVYVVLAVLFVLLAGAMFDLYSMDLASQRLQRIQARLRGRWGLVGILVIGVLSGAAATACITPVIFGALAYVAQKGNPALGFGIFFAMAWGMGLPLVAAGTLSGLAKSLPQSGGWMVVVKRVFGWALLGVAVYFVGRSRLLPEFWFSMGVGAFLVVAAVFWGAFDRLTVEAGWPRRARKAVGLLLLVGALAAFLQPLEGRLGTSPVPGQGRQSIQWLSSEQAALARMEQTGKPVLIDFWAPWCAPCLRMFETTYRDPRVMAEMEGYVPLKVNVDEEPALREKYGIRGVPTVLILRPDGARESHPDYIGPEEMLRILRR